MFTNGTQPTAAVATPVAPPVAAAIGHHVVSKPLTGVAGVALIGFFGLTEVALRIGHFFGRRFG